MILGYEVEVLYADSFEKPQMNEIINHILLPLMSKKFVKIHTFLP